MIILQCSLPKKNGPSVFSEIPKLYYAVLISRPCNPGSVLFHATKSSTIFLGGFPVRIDRGVDEPLGGRLLLSALGRVCRGDGERGGGVAGVHGGGGGWGETGRGLFSFCLAVRDDTEPPQEEQQQEKAHPLCEKCKALPNNGPK